MNNLLTVFLALVFGALGGMAIALAALRSGHFITRDEMDGFVDKMAHACEELNENILSRYSELHSRITYCDDCQIKDVQELRREWENHKLWSLTTWNAIANESDKGPVDIPEPVKELETPFYYDHSNSVILAKDEMDKNVRDFVTEYISKNSDIPGVAVIDIEDGFKKEETNDTVEM